MNILQKIEVCQNWADIEALKDEARQACQLAALNKRSFDLFRLGMAGPHLESTYGVDVERLAAAVAVAIIPAMVANRLQPADVTPQHLLIAAAGLPVARLLGMLPYKGEMPNLEEVEYLLRERYRAERANGALAMDSGDGGGDDAPAFVQQWTAVGKGLALDYVGDESVLDQLVEHTMRPLRALLSLGE